MERFAETTFANPYFAHILGDDDVALEPLICGSCHAPTTELFQCTWDEELQVGPCCMPDPDCSCQTNGDLFGPRGCELHDANSPWNVRLRALTAVQQYERQVA